MTDKDIPVEPEALPEPAEPAPADGPDLSEERFPPPDELNHERWSL